MSGRASTRGLVGSGSGRQEKSRRPGRPPLVGGEYINIGSNTAPLVDRAWRWAKKEGAEAPFSLESKPFERLIKRKNVFFQLVTITLFALFDHLLVHSLFVDQLKTYLKMI